MKISNISEMTWMAVTAFSLWGGVVNFILYNKGDADSSLKSSFLALFRQLIISIFMGIIGALWSAEYGLSANKIIAISGVLSLMSHSAIKVWINRILNLNKSIK